MKGALSKFIIPLFCFFFFAPLARAQEELIPEEIDEYEEIELYDVQEEATVETNVSSPSEEYDDDLLEKMSDIAKTHDIEEDDNRNWWYLLKKGRFNINDTTIVYPKFLKFCVDVYHWGDKFFNTFDTDYVEGTGYRWKARLVNEDWGDSYALRFKKTGTHMRMLSDFNVNLGAYIQYMAVSVGYSADLNSIFRGKKNDHSRFQTNFTCALFNFDLSYIKNSSTKIRQFIGYNDNHLINSDFPGVTAKNFNISLYYFINNKKYSQGAAYNFSRYQRKSAGSFMVGFAYNNLDITMDFNTLAEELKPFFKFPTDYLHLHYFSYCALVGYGYNWVFHPKWLFNITVMPSVGFNRCYEDSSDGKGYQLALNIDGKSSVTFNHKLMFASLIGKITGNWYTSSNLSLFNAVEYLSLTVGVRF